MSRRRRAIGSLLDLQVLMTVHRSLQAAMPPLMGAAADDDKLDCRGTDLNRGPGASPEGRSRFAQVDPQELDRTRQVREGSQSAPEAGAPSSPQASTSEAPSPDRGPGSAAKSAGAGEGDLRRRICGALVRAAELGRSMTMSIVAESCAGGSDGLALGRSTLRSAAARAHFSGFGAGADPAGRPPVAVADALAAMRARDEEVRAGALKGMTDVLKAAHAAGGSAGDAVDDPSTLMAALGSLVSAEKSHKARRRALQVMGLLVECGASRPPASLRPLLQAAAATERHPRVVRYAAQVIADALSQELEVARSGGAGGGGEGEREGETPLGRRQGGGEAGGGVEWLVGWIREASEPTEVVDVRRGAASALRSIRILALALEEDVPAWLADKCAECWGLALRLIEDEEDEIRQHVAEVSEKLPPEGFGSMDSKKQAYHKATYSAVL